VEKLIIRGRPAKLGGPIFTASENHNLSSKISSTEEIVEAL
jgi:hypothetical protein